MAQDHKMACRDTDFGRAIVGSLMEIALNGAAEFDDGRTPAPTVDPKGYSRGQAGDPDTPGERVCGYVQKIEEDRVFLTPNDPQVNSRLPLGRFYVDKDAIYSITSKSERFTPGHRRVFGCGKNAINSRPNFGCGRSGRNDS